MRGRRRQRKKMMKRLMIAPGKSYWRFMQESKKAFENLLVALKEKTY